MYNEISTIVLGVSLASERLLELLKTVMPWLAVQKSSTEDNREWCWPEIARRVVIQLVSFLTGWITAGLVAGNGSYIKWFGSISIDETSSISVFIVGLLSSGGSVFWTQVVAYTKAAKDIKKLEAQDEREAFRRKNLTRARSTKFQDRINLLSEDQPNL